MKLHIHRSLLYQNMLLLAAYFDKRDKGEMKILIVDDNLKMRELLRVFLSDVADVCECSDGDEVIAIYADCKPTWVVMDVQMRRVGGIIATRMLITAFPESRVVMLSKHDDPEIRAAAIEAGAVDFLVKD